LFYKKFPDAPESKSVALSLLSSNIPKYAEASSTYTTNKPIKAEEEDQGREYIFNDFTAGAYQVLNN